MKRRFEFDWNPLFFRADFNNKGVKFEIACWEPRDNLHSDIEYTNQWR